MSPVVGNLLPPAEVWRPPVRRPPAVEALLTAALHSGNQYDFALVVRLTLLGLRIFEATGLLGMGTALALAASPDGDTVP
jgi:hypothetical protein